MCAILRPSSPKIILSVPTHTQQAGRQEEALGLIHDATTALGVPSTKYWYRILLGPYFRSPGPGGKTKGGGGGGGRAGPDYQVRKYARACVGLCVGSLKSGGPRRRTHANISDAAYMDTANKHRASGGCSSPPPLLTKRQWTRRPSPSSSTRSVRARMLTLLTTPTPILISISIRLTRIDR